MWFADSDNSVVTGSRKQVVPHGELLFRVAGNMSSQVLWEHCRELGNLNQTLIKSVSSFPRGQGRPYLSCKAYVWHAASHMFNPQHLHAKVFLWQIKWKALVW